ncbi:hypothetical protein [Nocardia concava]|uniref:hypothetical protein n=1 Tax=Nocardia concava TaxID=257281 RepID=UPI0002EF4824|nr:hypothetical protein [Nocardia concava]
MQFTDTQIALIREHLAKGMTPDSIANMFGRLNDDLEDDAIAAIRTTAIELSNEGREDDDAEDVVHDRDALVEQFRSLSNEMRWLGAQLGRYCTDRTSDLLPILVSEFHRLAKTVTHPDLDSLFLRSGAVQYTFGMGNPDFGPQVAPTPFVRRMPADQARIESARNSRCVWHARTYELHIAEAFSHFAAVLTALVDGALACEWEILDHENPKLEELVEEVDRAYTIWASLHTKR